MVSEMGGQLNSAWHSSTTVCDLTQKILMKQETMRWQWHQPDHMQIICISLKTDNDASTSSLNKTTLNK